MAVPWHAMVLPCYPWQCYGMNEWLVLPKQRPQPLLVHREGPRELNGRRVLQRRHRTDGLPYARTTVAAAGRRRGFGGFSGRHRADSVAGVQHNLHASVTAITAVAVTDVTFAAVAVKAVAVTSSTVRAVVIIVVTVTDVTVTYITLKAVAVTSVTVAVANPAVTITVDAATAGVWPYLLEDGSAFRRAHDSVLGHASGKRRGLLL